MKQVALKPLIRGNQTASFRRVNQTLVRWARCVGARRKVMLRIFAQHGDGQIVPCEEETCGKALRIGDPVLIISFNTKGRQHRVFCSVACQRRNYVATRSQAVMDRQIMRGEA